MLLKILRDSKKGKTHDLTIFEECYIGEYGNSMDFFLWQFSKILYTFVNRNTFWSQSFSLGSLAVRILNDRKKRASSTPSTFSFERTSRKSYRDLFDRHVHFYCDTWPLFLRPPFYFIHARDRMWRLERKEIGARWRWKKNRREKLRDKWQSEFFRENAMRRFFSIFFLNRGVVHRRNYFLNFLSMEKSFGNQRKEVDHLDSFFFLFTINLNRSMALLVSKQN